MRTKHHVITEASENRFSETDSFEEAIRIARSAAREGQTGDLVSIEHQGKVIRQLRLLLNGSVAEEEIH